MDNNRVFFIFFYSCQRPHKLKQDFFFVKDSIKHSILSPPVRLPHGAPLRPLGHPAGQHERAGAHRARAVAPRRLRQPGTAAPRVALSVEDLGNCWGHKLSGFFVRTVGIVVESGQKKTKNMMVNQCYVMTIFLLTCVSALFLPALSVPPMRWTELPSAAADP